MVPFTRYIIPGFPQKFTKHTKRKKKKPKKQKKIVKRNKTNIKTRLRRGRDFEFSDWEFKVTMINTLRALMGKVDNMQEQMGNVKREL